MSDIIERAEAALLEDPVTRSPFVMGSLICELVVALKAARAENERLKEFNTYLAIWNTVYSGGSR